MRAVHDLQVLGQQRLEVHLIKHIALQVDARRDLEHLDALGGEAEAGPDYSLEDELGDNSFGPDQLAEVIAKYKSGPRGHNKPK